MRRSDRVLLRLTVQLVSPPSHSSICLQTHNDDDDADDHHDDDVERNICPQTNYDDPGDQYVDDADDDVQQVKHLSPTKC